MATFDNITMLFRRGLKADLPVLAPQGEAFYCTDTLELFIGTGSGIALAKTDSDIAKAYADTILAGEASTRSAADTILAAAISSETGRATSVEGGIENDLATEVTRAEAAEAVLTSAVSSEATARASADSTEATARIAGDSSTLSTSETYADSAVLTERTRALAAEALLAPLASPGLTGTPTAPTPSALDGSTKLATTAYSDAAVLVEKTRALAAEASVSALISVKQVIIDIPSATLKTLRATPLTLVAGVAGVVNVPLEALIDYKFGTQAYTGGSSLVIQFHGSVTPLLCSTLSTLITAAASTFDIVFPQNGSALGTQLLRTVGNNVAVEIHNTGGTEYTGGDGTVRVVLQYMAITLS